MDLLERLRRALARRERVELRAAGATACGVLVPILPDGGGHAVVYTLRSDALPNHRGQVSFPGGKRAPGDRSLLDTALREAREEIGIDPKDVEILGRLDDVGTLVTDFVITPFVGLLPAGQTFRPNPNEVSDVFTVRLEDLLDERHHGTMKQRWGRHEVDVDVITAGRHPIWGATHRITCNLIDCLRAEQGEGRP